MTPLPTIAIAALALLTFGSPALAQDERLPRTPWQKAEPAHGKAVRWVVEGCAAYPVTVDAESEMPVSGGAPEAEAAMAASTTNPTVPRQQQDHIGKITEFEL